jgi:hypothetical protein
MNLNRALIALILIGLLIFDLTNEAQAKRVHDYIFSITGVVTTEAAVPIQDAEITLDVNGPVYNGMELVKTVKCMTNNAGGFLFTYMSHKRGVKYSITVRKEGFEPQTLSGASPPASQHTIHLKRASNSGS